MLNNYFNVLQVGCSSNVCECLRSNKAVRAARCVNPEGVELHDLPAIDELRQRKLQEVKNYK